MLGLPVGTVVAFPQASEEQMLLRRNYFMQERVKKRLLYFCSHVPCASHSKMQLKFTTDVIDEVFMLFAEAEKKVNFREELEGPMIRPIFREA